MSTKTKRICDNGHEYYKSSDCPVCPLCENQKEYKSTLLSVLSAPARRALEAHQISSLEDLQNFTKQEIRAWHGIGSSALKRIEEMMSEGGVGFKK